ncbi:flavodoxin domain-containing protein [Flagellimonas aequoris]|uniref:Flavodoxin domain-containing protein n=1 Tax=Flagellimonas aequoris TaxID=2306997 RepID=A0A418NBJ0_9FLAO|nr:flavodoxin domain-containing protein [Allomuricauda aequoris]RIV73945.1 hypothetical protein D2U88_02620 [Allomuricauda aequoris]TXK07635.1 hypothetical protein FQ019_02600 [Allomuricauda aequoris]
MKILIVYGTMEGQTTKIAHFMEELLQKENHKVVLANASKNPPTPDSFDAILIGSSIHLNTYNPSIRGYIKNNVEVLNKKITGFFSVSMAIISDLPEKQHEIDQIAKKFLIDSSWNAVEIWHIAGALKFTKYDYLKKITMRSIAKKEDGPIDINKDYEYTNWTKVKNQVSQFSNHLKINSNGQT